MTVSSSSSRLSPIRLIVIFSETLFGAKVSVPLEAVKSAPSVAVLPIARQPTLTCLDEGVSRVAASVKLPADSDVELSRMLSCGGLSSSVMVRTACVSTKVPLVGFDRVIMTVSSSSSSVSAKIGTGICLTVSLALKVIWPVLAVKSSPAVAVPPVRA